MPKHRLASTALARPHVNRSTAVDNATVVLLVDVSGSMSATDVEPTRLDAATAAMRAFLDRLPRRSLGCGLALADGFDRALRRRLRELARHQVVAQVALGHLDQIALLAERVDILEEDCFRHPRSP